MNNLSVLLRHWVSRDALAPSFDAAFYRMTQADLAHLDEAGLVAHYNNHGRDEGRIASPAAHREGFLAQIPIEKPILEIGPSVRPALIGDHVRYFDLIDSVGQIERAAAEGYSSEACPEIHYVSANGDLSVIPDRFSAVFSSHCIEHQPDLVHHLCQVADLLEDGGRYYVIVPDYRYCFDASLAASTPDEVLAAHREGRRVHTLHNIFAHWVYSTHNDTDRHWAGDNEDPRADQRTERAEAVLSLIEQSNGGYIDVHAWRFDPANFAATFDAILTYVPFELEHVYDTMRGRNEFGAVLRKR